MGPVQQGQVEDPGHIPHEERRYEERAADQLLQAFERQEVAYISKIRSNISAAHYNPVLRAYQLATPFIAD